MTDTDGEQNPEAKLRALLGQRPTPPPVEDLAEIRARAAQRISTTPHGITLAQAEADRRALLRLFDAAADRVHIVELGLDRRAYNLLKRAHIWHVGQLIDLTEERLAGMPGMGPVSVRNIKARLRNELGLTLRQDGEVDGD